MRKALLLPIGFILAVIIGAVLILLSYEKGTASASSSPYLINLAVSKVSHGATHDEAWLVVKTDVMTGIVVEYGTQPQPPGVPYPSSVSSGGTVAYRFELPLDNLPPSSQIYYRVKTSSGQVLAEQHSFHTTRAPGEAFSFGATSDNHPGGLDVAQQLPVWSTIVGQMAGENLDFTVHSGDIISGWPTVDPASGGSWDGVIIKYQAFFSVMMPLTAQTPFYTAVGNHEYIRYPYGKPAFESEFTLPVNNGADAATYGEEYYSFDNGDTHFAVVCTEIPGQEGYIANAQEDWLARDLVASTKPWKVVVMHQPMFLGPDRNSYPYWGNEYPVWGNIDTNAPWNGAHFATALQNRNDLHALFRSTGVDLVLEGHSHHYARHMQDGIAYVINAGSGILEQSPGGVPVMFPGDTGALDNEHVKVDETPRSLSFKSINDQGGLLDSYAMSNSMLTIRDGDGGDCKQIGQWDPASRTCTLTSDVFSRDGDGISVAGDGITLDGGGHRLLGTRDYAAQHKGVLIDASNVTVRNLGIEGFWLGVWARSAAAGSLVEGDTLSGNSYGVYLAAATDMTVRDNALTGSDSAAVNLFGASHNALTGNTLSASAIGVRLQSGSDGNLIYQNTFNGNSTQAVVEDGGGNVFSPSLPAGGNLWSDWLAPDSDRNGIVDIPYESNGVRDTLPWSEQGGWLHPPPCGGRPALALSLDRVYWASYASYTSRVLSVDFSLTNSTGPAAFDVTSPGDILTEGVTVVGEGRRAMGNLAEGGTTRFSAEYQVPADVSSFRATVYLTATDVCGSTFEYPGPFPG